jgi:hypothetical protein
MIGMTLKLHARLIVISVGLMLIGVGAAAAEERLARISGTAFLDRRTKVIGAVVLIANEDNPAQLFMTSTDAIGKFVSTELPEGSYRVDVRRQGYQAVVKERVALRPPFRAVVELKMEKAAGVSMPQISNTDGQATRPSVVTVNGQILDEDNTPLSQIRLRLVHPTGKVDPVTVYSGTDGHFDATGLKAGHWQIEITGVGYLPIVTTFELNQASQLVLKLVKQPPDYEPSPLELMTAEQPVTPAGMK